MFQKLAPLIILAIFALGTIFVIQGLNKASEMTKPKQSIQHEGAK